MANNWWEENWRNQDDVYRRRGDDRTIDYGRGYDRQRTERHDERFYGGPFGHDATDRSSERFDYPTDKPMDFTGRGPKGYRRSDERIREDVSEILERHPGIDASEMEVDVKDGVVSLRGHAEDRQQKRLAEDVIERIPGIRDIRNELTLNQSLFQRARQALFGGDTSSTGSGTQHGDLINQRSDRDANH